MSAEERNMNRWLIVYLLIAAVALGMVIGNAWPVPSRHAQEPDWTVAPCMMWADTDSPVLPAHTRTDVCAAQTETGAWYISSPTNPSPLAP